MSMRHDSTFHLGVGGGPFTFYVNKGEEGRGITNFYPRTWASISKLSTNREGGLKNCQRIFYVEFESPIFLSSWRSFSMRDRPFMTLDYFGPFLIPHKRMKSDLSEPSTIWDHIRIASEILKSHFPSLPVPKQFTTSGYFLLCCKTKLHNCVKDKWVMKTAFICTNQLIKAQRLYDKFSLQYFY